jgi:hypothetical protein
MGRRQEEVVVVVSVAAAAAAAAVRDDRRRCPGLDFRRVLLRKQMAKGTHFFSLFI